jgi:HAD superfamily hydrolase (TIGR01490 family)
MRGAAAFFDLDRTLLRRSSALALAPAFRAHKLISRRQVARAAAWQVMFMLGDAGAETVRRAAEDGLLVLRGYSPAEMQALVVESMEEVLKPLVYAESLDLVQHHRNRGEPVYIVSATLQEIVQVIADDLGFDGALGDLRSRGQQVHRTRDRHCRAGGEGRCIEGRDYDLSASTAYSDSYTDLPFLEAVGHPVAVNPDRRLRRVARERNWPVLEFGRRAA